MAKSQELIGLLKDIIVTDATSEYPIINYFLDNDLEGGWEGWLQVEFARVVRKNTNIGFRREVNFTGTFKRCDLFFQADRGAPMWVELKTQRRADYQNTVNDFADDIFKIYNLSIEFKNVNVLVAMAVLRLQGEDAVKLNQLRLLVKGGTMQYFLFTGNLYAPWIDVTDNILTTTTTGKQLIVATYRVF